MSTPVGGLANVDGEPVQLFRYNLELAEASEGRCVYILPDNTIYAWYGYKAIDKGAQGRGKSSDSQRIDL